MVETHLKTYVGALTALAAALAASWVYWYGLQFDYGLALGAGVFAGLVLLGFVLSVRIGEHTAMGTWDVWLILAVVTLGPTWAALAVVPTAFFVGRRDWLRVLYDASQNVITVHLAGAAFSLVSGPLLLSGGENVATLCYGTIAAGVTLVVANEAIDGGLLRVKHGQSFRETWEENWRPYLLSDVANVLTAGLGVLAFLVYGPVASLVAVAGAMGSRTLAYRSREHVKKTREVLEQNRSLREALVTSNTTFGGKIIHELGRKDGYTHRHAAATAVYAEDLGREMGLEGALVARVRMAGLLHNVGLFGLPDELLLTMGKLNSVARQQIAEHPSRGEEMLAAVSEFKDVASWVRWHHERPDGRGYPDKLRGPWIPVEAMILAVAQAYAAMVLDQPRRPGIGSDKAREQLISGIDTEFDGTVLKAFLRILDTESVGYRMADDHRFVFSAALRTHARQDASSAGDGPARHGADGVSGAK